MSDKVILNEDQKKAVIDEWNSRPDDPPSLLELIRAAFPDTDFDGRSKEGRAVKAFLAERQIKARPAHQYQSKDDIELTDEQKEFVDNNYKMMTFVEIARVLFANQKINNLNKEAKAVQDYIKEIDPSHDTGEAINVVHEEYKSPRTFDKAIWKINDYLFEKIDKSKITPKQKKDVEALLKYINTYRFIHQINSYDSNTDRELFESSFIRYCYDKNDLTEEEVDQYIVLSSEVVIASNIQLRVEHLQDLLDNTAHDSEGRSISMSLVEAIGKAQNDYHQSVNRQNKLLNDLKEKRSDRIKNQLKDNASILNLVEVWKNEETRKNMIRYAEMRKEIVKEEVEKLSSMDEIKCKIMGISEDEVLN